MLPHVALIARIAVHWVSLIMMAALVENKMRAVTCRAWGPIDTLKVEEIAPPTPAADEVLIDVRATSVNYADAIMVAGNYQTRPPFPFSPGLETAGVVARCGNGVTRFPPGDRGLDLLGWGGLAEEGRAM